MIFHWALYKVKSFFVIFIYIFRRAMCCIRKRRHSNSDSEPLTHVISNVEQQNEAPTWSEWGDDGLRESKPKTVQDYIEKYRQETMKTRTGENAEENPEEKLNFFEDMAPEIKAQTKVLIRTKQDKRMSNTSRLSVVEDNVRVVPSGELGEWNETSGWEGEQLLDQEAQKVLREQKRLERERKAWEQHQKRLEKTTRTLGSKLTT